ncbi:hypothetical protein Pfo_021995 [Paulownia fortunei]|nr:hypothetical protein Pfo_021995 [Paulownia fortunei]
MNFNFLNLWSVPKLNCLPTTKFMSDLIVAGADTTADSVQWAMTELLRNPEKMSKAKEELRTFIGENKQVEESDISKLPYLHAVIKETFRCHPAGPFLIPHKAEANIEINGYMVPKDAQILVNPERFLDGKIEYRGHDFEFITFGSGRRICQGLPLAHLMWKLEPGMKPEELDLNELFGLSLHKAVPLKAFPFKQ